ncbi:thiamine diphosphokinase [Rhodobacterales bacterium HKCCA1288]|uniref:thiamine diphosphokinase n=1 Tax=Roseovarius sp. 10 TaxID=3080563 RepID=UPI001935F6C8|nr:thiamine diphosphokinase [Roseovarius sp. 10]MBF9056738.1 thiamine diphosphokinase [Rhodobacterales bacterium HKCCA1065]MDV7200874.1 thiamine diphosphokinase [Roseovarius sp. 10]QPI85264.1 thiamine diphosphokinase [Rhodobacterales bacterium HKCCA1288]
MNSCEIRHNAAGEPRIVSETGLICLIGGGAVDFEAVQDLVARGAILVAADGGADHARALGLRPVAVIGDMDSISPETRDQFGDLLHHIPEQDSTDFEKSLRVLDVAGIVGFGFLGPRADHGLAAMQALARHQGAPVILQSAQDVVFHLPAHREMAFELPPETRVSLFPFASVACAAEGLRWPLDGLTFDPMGQIGTSNKATGGALRLMAKGAGLLAILPARHRDQVLQSFGLSL